jgi:hypothetical protein
MSQSELLARVIGALDAAGIVYMVTVSIMSSFYGEPRASHDIDVVVGIHEAHLSQLAASFPAPT